MTHRSPGAFCSVVVSTTTGVFDSVQSQNTGPLGDGAECFCLANRSAYRFNAGSSQATLGDTFIRPTSGGGCWEKQNANADYSQQVTGTTNFDGGTGALLSLNQWNPYPGTAGAYAPSFAGTMWSVNTSNGLMSYHEPAGLRFNILTTTVVNLSATSDQSYEFTATKNGALVTSTTNDPSAVVLTLPHDTSSVEAVYNFIATPATSDFYQNCFRWGGPSGASGTITFNRYTVLISQA